MKAFIIEQLDYIALQLMVARLYIIEAQQKSLEKPCRLVQDCIVCKIKRKTLRGRAEQ